MPENTAQHQNGNHSVATGNGVRPYRWRRWAVAGVIALILIIAGLVWGVSWVEAYFNTVSTNDAYVSGHATNVAPRIEANVVEVPVNNSNFVEAGTVLVRLDPVPFQLLVRQKQAAVQVAKANLDQTLAKIRSQEAEARASWYTLLGAQNQVRNQLAILRANLANLQLAEANQRLAQSEYNRAAQLASTGAATSQEVEQRQNALQVDQKQVAAAREALEQTRASLGLPRDEKNPLEVPADLEDTFPAVQTALSNAAMALATIGMPIQLHNLTPKKLHQQLENMNPQHDFNKALDQLVEKSPQVLYARAQVAQATDDLQQAELNLSYTVIRAPMAGFIGQRNVNPGDHVLPGQILMALRSFAEVWIDANFKETQINDLAIGLPVDVYVDAYPGRVFKGRVAGFEPATGSASALLPPENATGNFVKVVQRLPVRIELTEPNSRDTPLFAGLSAEPVVYYKATPSGPNAGQRLRVVWQPDAARPPESPPRPPPGGAVQPPQPGTPAPGPPTMPPGRAIAPPQTGTPRTPAQSSQIIR